MKIIIRNFITTLKRFKSPTILNILGLSVAFTAFIIIIMQVMFEHGYDKQYPKSERIYRLAVHFNDESYGIFNKKNIDDLKKASPHIDQITCIGEFSFFDNHFKVRKSSGAEEIVEASIREVLPDFKDIFDVEIVEGDSNVLQNPNTLLIPQSLAHKVFGNESPVGQMFGQYPIGAVYRDFPKNSVIPNCIYSSIPANASQLNGFNHVIMFTLDSPQNKAVAEEQIRTKIAELYINQLQVDASINPIEELYFDNTIKFDIGGKGNKSNTNIFLAVAILIILIASINYINFASALTPVRIKIINMQKILGGSQRTIRLSIMFETIAIVLLSYGIGVLMVYLLETSRLASHFDSNLLLSENQMSLLLTFGVAIVVGILSGLHPTFYMTSFAPILTLKGSFGMSAKGRHFRSVLIGIQYIISIVLIISMFLINRQNKFIGHFELGFDKKNVLVTKIPLDMSRNHRSLLEVKIQEKTTLSGIAFSLFEFGGTETYSIMGREKDNKEFLYYCDQVSYNFLDVLGISVVEGRNFNKLDSQTDQSYIIFNQYAKITDSLVVNEEFAGYKILGFTANEFRANSIRSANISFAFTLENDYSLPFQYTYIKINEGANISDAIADINDVFHEVEPAFTPSLTFIDDVTNKLYQKEHRAGYLISTFSTLAIIISLIGVFGLVMFETQYRRKEIGVRRVFGSSILSILALINRKFIRIALVCFVVATPIAYYAIDQWLSGFANRTNIPWWVFPLALIIVLIITVATVTIRSYNTATENPAQSVKTE